MKHKFWNFTHNKDTPSELSLYGEITSEQWFSDEITPQLFKAELSKCTGDIIVKVNSPGGDVTAAAEIYTALKDYPHNITVKIDSMAASAASFIAMAGDKVMMSPVSWMLIHNPMTIAVGNKEDMQDAIDTLEKIKDGIVNAYEMKTGLSRTRISHLMDAETLMSPQEAVSLGFADGILYAEDVAICDPLENETGTPIDQLETRLNLLK